MYKRHAEHHTEPHYARGQTTQTCARANHNKVIYQVDVDGLARARRRLCTYYTR